MPYRLKPGSGSPIRVTSPAGEKSGCENVFLAGEARPDPRDSRSAIAAIANLLTIRILSFRLARDSFLLHARKSLIPSR